MANDVFVWIVLGIIQIGTAVYGGILSIKTKGKDRTKNIVVFVVLGVFGAILIVYSGVRTYDAQRANEQIQKELRQQVQVLRQITNPFYSSGNLTSATLIVSGKGIMGDISIKTSNNCSVTCYDGISKTDDPRAVIWDLPCVNLSCFASASRAFNKGLYCIPSQTTNCTYNVSYKSR
jgi:hypothetical protein